MQHGTGRDLDQVFAIIDAFDPDTRRKKRDGVDALHFTLNTLDGRRALFAAPHENDALNNVVVIVHAGDAKTRLRPDLYRRHIAHENRKSAILSQHRAAEVFYAADQANAAHHCRLRTNVDCVAADIDVAAVQRLNHLWERKFRSNELVEIDLNLVLPGLAAPAGHVDDTGYCPEAPLQVPNPAMS